MTALVCTHPEPYDEALVSRIRERFGVSSLLAKALIRRGITAEADIRAFLYPADRPLSDPFRLPDMREAVARIRLAISHNERICIYGDYDADGVCATAILLRFLRDRTQNVRAYIPSRHDEGYGMHAGAVRALAADGVTLLITVDNGVSALDEVALCGTLGMDVIVTDHHRVGERLPACCAVVSATRADSAYPDRNLCGAGVALQLVRALSDGGPVPADALAFAAVATIADVVPLFGENRSIAASGLPLVSGQTGLSALMRAAGLTENRLASTAAAYTIAPRLNAAGRMGDAALSLSLLMTEDAAEALSIAEQLNVANRDRREEEARVFAAAEAMAHARSLQRRGAVLVCGSGWNKGVLGIVASRVTERFHRPAIVFTSDADGLLHGSGRSVDGVDLYAALAACKGHFLRFGGHAGAAGITMRASAFEAFCADFCGRIERSYPPETFFKKLAYEQAVSLAELDHASVRELARLAPFGEGNPEPVYRIDNARLRFGKRMGKDGQHFSAELCQSGRAMRLVAFGMGDACGRLLDEIAQDVLATASVRTYLGRESVELFARGICAHDVRILNFYDAIPDGILYNKERVSMGEAASPHLDGLGDLLSRDDYAPDAMRRRYRTLRHMLAGDGLPVQSVLDRLPLAQLLSLLVFVELGFFHADPGPMTLCAAIGCKAQPLENSSLYRRLRSMDGGQPN